MIPKPCTAESNCSISASSQLAQDLLAVEFIIWDEVVMCNKYCTEAVNRSLRDIARRKVQFGGKCVLFSGDFRQNIPVIPERWRAQIVYGCVKSSALCPSVCQLLAHRTACRARKGVSAHADRSCVFAGAQRCLTRAGSSRRGNAPSCSFKQGIRREARHSRNFFKPNGLALHRCAIGALLVTNANFVRHTSSAHLLHFPIVPSFRALQSKLHSLPHLTKNAPVRPHVFRRYPRGVQR